jgi:hypothetical protein
VPELARLVCAGGAQDHFGAGLKVAICSITGFHSDCSARM